MDGEQGPRAHEARITGPQLAVAKFESPTPTGSGNGGSAVATATKAERPATARADDDEEVTVLSEGEYGADHGG
jgi:hypothetical protein